MPTFKQLEAMYWVSRLGTFSAAAAKLHTSESGISKRISELESFFETQLFDRSRRTAQLTPKGKELFELGSGLLNLRDNMLSRMNKESATIRRFRIGVTELTALTWLPKLVHALQDEYPGVLIEPEIDLSTNLCQKLDQGHLDLVVVPPVFRGIRYVEVPLDKVELSWMCRPKLIEEPRPLALETIAKHPILMQIGSSGVDLAIDQWLRQKGLKFHRVFAGNSLIALAALTVSGFGVSFLPVLYFQDLIDQGALCALEVSDPLPKIQYHAVSRDDGTTSSFNVHVAELCVRFCDFSKPSLAIA